MTRARRYATALLIAAGLVWVGSMLSASIPNVQSGTWAPASALTDARGGASSALMADGRVLITGGVGADGTTVLASAEIFDTNGAVYAAAPMNVPRSRHASVTLKDGRVLVVGGTTSGAIAANTAEIYDPPSNTWTFTGLMAEARSGLTASLIASQFSQLPNDGAVLVAGGESGGVASATVEVFDPATGNFDGAVAGALSSPRAYQAAAVLLDGRIVIAGGSDGTSPVASIDIYDPSIGIVSPASAFLSSPRAGLSATTLLNGNVLIAGGNNGTTDLATADVFDAPSGTISIADNTLGAGRSGHLAFLLPHNNGVLIVGGSSNGSPAASAELFVPWAGANGTFWATGAPATALVNATGSALSFPASTIIRTGPNDGKVLVAGGDALSSTELYGFATVNTDQEDYAPGTTVTITGNGWQPGETVTLTLVEDPYLDTHPVMTAIADGAGNIISTDFVPDEHDVGIRFYLTAVGAASQAQTTFTDNENLDSVTVGSQSPALIAPGASATYTITVGFSKVGSNDTCIADLTISGLTSGASLGSFAPASLTQSNSDTDLTSTLTVNTTGAIATGTTSFTVTATGRAGSSPGCAGVVRTGTGSLVVSAPTKVLVETAANGTGGVVPTQSLPTGNSITAFAIARNAANTFLGNIPATWSLVSTTGGVTGTDLVPAGDSKSATFTGHLAGTGRIHAASGALTSTDSGVLTVVAGAATKFVITGSGTQTAGTSQNLTITAKDAAGNTATSYAGAKSLTFSGAASSTNPVTAPTVTNNAGPAIAFGTPENITFASGVATVGGSMTLYAAETANIVATQGTITTTGTDRLTVVVSAAGLNKFALALTSPQNNGVAFTGANTLTAQDAFGNTVTGFNAATDNVTVTANFPLTGAVSGLGSGATSVLNQAGDFSSGVANLTTLGMMYDGNAATGTFTATSSTAKTGTSGSVTINAGAATAVEYVSPSAADLASGATRTFTARIRDANGNTVTGFVGSIVFTQTAGPGTTSGLPQTRTVAGGQATTLNITGQLAGNVTVTATSGALTSAATSFNVVAGAAAAVEYVSPDTSGLASGSTRTFTARIRDAGGNTVTGFVGSIVFTQTAGPGTTSGLPQTRTVASGQATTTNITALLAGNVTVTATSGALTSAATSFSVVAGAANEVEFVSPDTSDLASGTTRTFTARIRDAGGNTVTGFAGNIDFTQTAGPGTTAGLPQSRTVASGQATTTNITSVLAGNVTITASSGALTSNATSFNVVAGAAAKLAFTTSPSNSTGGVAFPTQPVVTLQDAGGNTVTGTAQNVTLAIQNNAGPGGVLSGTTTVAVNTTTGLATFSALSINKAGTGYTLTATGSTVNTTAGVAVSAAFNITTGAAAKLAFTTSPSNSTGGVAFPTQPVVTLQDAGGNTVTGTAQNVTLAIQNNAGPGGVLSGTMTVAVNTTTGLATFSALSINKAGTGYTLTATGDTVSTTAAVVVSGAFNIAAGAAAKLAVTTSPANSTGGVAFPTQPVVTLQDAGGNTVTGTAQNVTLAIQNNAGPGGVLSGTTTVAVNTGTGVAAFSGLSIDKAGTGYTLTATGSTVSTSPGVVVSNAFNITVGAAVAVEYVGPDTSSLTSGATRTFTARIRDAGGNIVTGFVGSIVFTQTAGPGTTSGLPQTRTVASGQATTTNITALLAGNVTVTATSGALTSAATSFSVVAGAANEVEFVSPDTSDLTSGTTRTFTARIRDAGGNTVTGFAGNIDFTQTAGPGTTAGLPQSRTVASGQATTTNITGVFVGNVTVTASNGALTSNTASFNVVAGAQDHLRFTASPGNTLANVAFATQPSVALEDAAGNLITDSNAKVTLSITSGTGTAGALLLPAACTAQVNVPASGVTPYSGCLIDKAGTAYTLIITKTGGNGLPNGTTTALSSAFNILSRSTTTSVICATNPVAVNQGTVCAATVSDSAGTGATTPAGQVTFSSNESGAFTVPGATCTLASAGPGSSTCSATYTPSSRGTGTHAISASYAGSNPHSASSTTTPFNLTVNKAAATITLSNLSQTFDGTPKFATAATTPPGLTVNITYSQSGNPVASPTDAGSYDVSATIADLNYQGSTTGTLTIGKATPTFSNLSAPSIAYGDGPTSFSGNLKAGSAVPTGSVSVTVNVTSQSGAITAGTGAFSASIATQAFGVAGSPYTITYSYAGDSNFFAATDTSRVLTIAKATATITLSNLTQTYDGTARFAGATTTPLGLTVNITYSQGGNPVASPTNAGSYDVSATISDANYQGSTTGTLTINKATPAFSNLSAPSIIFGDGPTGFSGTLAAGSAIPTGSVSVMVNVVSQSGAVTAGTGAFSASIATQSFGVSGSPYPITYSYPGDNNFFGASDATQVLTVAARATTTSVASDINPSKTGEQVTFTATVLPAGVSGSVDFYDGVNLLTSVSLTGNQAQLQKSDLTPGAHAITAVYVPDLNHSASTSSVLTQTVDTPSVAVADAYALFSDTLLAVGAPGVLGNDNDADAGQTVTAVLSVPPTHAAASGFTLNADGSFSYMPGTSYTGPDSFTYKPNDGTFDGDEVTVTLAVLAANASPVAENDAYHIGSNTMLSVPTAEGVLNNDHATLPISTVLVSGPDHAAASGFTLNADGSFDYTPETGFTGVDSFIYRANDGSTNSNPALVTIAVTDAALVASNDGYTVDENGTLTVLQADGVLFNDGGGPTAAALVLGPLYGSVSLAADGSFDYTPATGFSGVDSFFYVATGGSGVSNLAMVSLRVRTATTFSNLASPTISYGTATTTLSGTISAGALVPPTSEHASITLDGVTHNAAIQSDGSFSSDFDTSALIVTSSPYQITYSYAGNAIFTAASDTSKSVTVQKATPTVTVTGGTFTYSGLAHPASATATGVGSVAVSGTFTFTYTPPGNATEPVHAGTYSVSASFTSSDPNYANAVGTGSITIEQASSTTVVTVAGGESFTYDGNPHPATVAVTGAGALSLTPAPVYSCGHAPIEVADSGCTASYTYAGDLNHTGSTDSKTYTISKADPVLTAVGGTFPYDGNPHAGSGTATGVHAEDLGAVSVAYSSAPGPGNLLPTAPVNAGTYYVAVRFAGSANYNAKQSAAVTLTITQASSTTVVTVAGGESFTYDGNPHPATVAVTGAGALSLTPAPVYSCGHAPIEVADSGCTASYTYAGDLNHTGSTDSKTYTISKADPVLTAVGGTFPYDGNPHAGSGTATGVHAEDLGAVSVAYSSAPGPGNLLPTAPVNAGTYYVAVRFAGSANYNAKQSAAVTLTITQASSTTVVTVAGGESFTYDGNPHPATVAVTGAGALSLTPAPVYSCGHAPIEVADSGCTASYTYAGDLNHTGSTDSKTYTISKADPVLTAVGGTFPYDGNPHAGSGTATGVHAEDLGAVSVAYSSAPGPGNLLPTAPVNAGTYYVAVRFAGSANYNAKQSAAVTLTITQASSTTVVTVAGGESFTYDGNPHPATVAVTGAGALSLTPAPVYSCGHAPIEVADSGCTASYTYAGDLNHTGSSDSKTYTISKADPVLTAVGGTFPYDGNPHAGSGTATGVHAEDLGAVSVAYSSAPGPGNLLPTAPVNAGTYYVAVRFAGSANYNAKQSAAVTLTITQASSTTVVTVAGGESFIYDGNPHPATVAVTGAGALSLTPAPVYSCGHAPIEVADSGCTASYTYAGDLNHTGSTDSKTYTISKADPVLTAVGGTFPYDGNPHAGSGTATGVHAEDLGAVSVAYSSAPGPGNLLPTAPVNAGTYYVAVRFAGSANYNAKQSAAVTLTITQASSTTVVTVAGGESFTYDGNPHPATVAVTGAGALSLTPAPVYSCGHAPIEVADSGCTASYTYAGDLNHTGSTDSKTYTISKADPVLTAVGGTFPYDGNPHAGSGTATGVHAEDLGAVSVAYSSAPGPGNLLPTAPVNAGTYYVAVRFAGSANYNPMQSAAVTLTINAATPNVIVTGGTFTYDGNPHPASAAATGVGNVPVGGSFAFTYTPPGDSTEPVNGGTYSVSASFTSSDSNYANAVGTGSITIERASPTVTAAASDATYAGSPYTGASGAATGVLAESLTPAVTLQYAGTGTTVYPHSTTPPTNAGTYSVRVSFVGNPNYAPGGANAAFTITKADTTTTITSDLPDPSQAGQSYSVVVTVAPQAPAVGNPGGTVAVNDGEGNNCTITLSGGTGNCSLTTTTTGSKTLTATYSGGDNNYNAGSSDTESHNVIPGAAAKVKVETLANGTGGVVPAQSVTAGNTVVGYAIRRDAFSNFIDNVVATWSLAAKTLGAADGDLVAAVDGKSATFTGHLVGTAQIHAAVSGLTSTDSGTLSVAAAAASRLVFTTAPQTFAINQTSATMTVQIQDPYANPINAGSNTTLYLSSTSAAPPVFRNTGDTADITTVVIGSGTNSASFKYKDFDAGTPTLKAGDQLVLSDSGLTDATQVQSLQPQAITLDNVAVDADFKQVDGFDILFGKGINNSVLELKNTNPGTLHYHLTLNNNTGVVINAANGNTAKAIIEVPPMTNCGGVACSPQVNTTLPAFELKARKAVHVYPDDHTDDMPVQFAYKAGGACLDPSGYSSTLPADSSPKCIMVSGFSIPKKHKARIDIHFEFRWKDTNNWAANPDPKINFRSGFAFKSTVDVSFVTPTPSVKTGYVSVGLVGAGQKVSAVGGFVFNNISQPLPGYQVRLFNSAAQASACTSLTNVVAGDTASPDGFYFIWRVGVDQTNVLAAPLPSGVKYYMQVCDPLNPATPKATRTLSNTLGNKEFDEEDFYVP